MSFTVHTAAARLSRQVPDAETAVDDAMLKIVEVIATSIGARRDTGVRETSGHAAIVRLHKALGSMIIVQSDLLRAHGLMLSVAKETGITEHTSCPDKPSGLNDSQMELLKIA